MECPLTPRIQAATAIRTGALLGLAGGLGWGLRSAAPTRSEPVEILRVLLGTTWGGAVAGIVGAWGVGRLLGDRELGRSAGALRLGLGPVAGGLAAVAGMVLAGAR